MKKVEAIVRPEQFNQVKLSLENAGFVGMTVTEVKGRGRQKGVVRQWRGESYQVDMLSKVKVELVVRDEDVGKVIGLIVDAARTGSVGDGKIFVLPIEQSVRIRTGEKDEAAL